MIHGAELVGESNLSIHGVSINSRDDLAGKLFIPIKGERFNGHKFVKDAFQKGAVASLWEKNELDYPKDVPLIMVEDTVAAIQQLSQAYRNELNVKVVGVTGSNGKTSTKDMVYAVLSSVFNVQKTEGNLNNHLGLPLSILKAAEDTEVLVLEMGMSSRGEIELLSKIAEPDAAIITNIGESHLQDLGSREEIAEAKLEITAGLKDHGALIYFGDEPLLQERVGRYEHAKLISFGQENTNDYYPNVVMQDRSGTTFSSNKALQSFYIPVLGKHNVYNALAAVAVGQAFDVPLKDIVSGLSKLELTQMRAEVIPGRNGSTIINDAYNASPTSMKAAIKLLQDLEGYREKYLVLGDMLELGDLEEEFHLETGKTVDPTKVDYVYTYGNLGQWIARGAKEKLGVGRVKSFLDKNELVRELVSVIGEKDAILVKASRGMKLEEVVEALKGDG